MMYGTVNSAQPFSNSRRCYKRRENETEKFSAK